MVIGPMPADIAGGKILDADQIQSTAPALPEWGARAHEFPQGHSTVTPEAEARWKAERVFIDRQRAVVIHPAERARQDAVETAARDAAARAQPDPRIALRDRHAEHAAAAAEAARVAAIARQADDLVAELRRRRGEAEAAVQAGETEAADKLAEAIAAGVGRDGYPLARNDQAQDKAAELATKLRTAETARDRLATESRTARDRETRARRELEIAALQLVNVAADIGGGIHQAEADLQRRRDNLMDLRTLLDREQRRLGQHRQLGIQGPPVLTRPEVVDPATEWSGVLARLIADPETVLEVTSEIVPPLPAA
jgi:hypothetical protein